MDKFEQLDVDKKQKIINGATKIFGQYGYQKASISQIANACNISKSMVFYYFKNKLNLYDFLVDFSFDHIVSKYEQNPIETTDFFEFLSESAKVKMIGFKEFPHLMKFITSFYFETNEEIIPLREQYLKRGELLRNKLVGPGLDYYKFKETVDPQKLMSMLVTWSEGYVTKAEYQLEILTDEQLEDYYSKMIKEFMMYLEMFKINFYKKEYL